MFIALPRKYVVNKGKLHHVNEHAGLRGEPRTVDQTRYLKVETTAGLKRLDT